MGSHGKIEHEHSAAVYRRMFAIAALVYLVWWFAVELLLPGAFNPFLSRALVTLALFGTLGLSYASPWIRRRLRLFFPAGVWLITAHYFYLLEGNGGSLEWIVGAFITVIAICFCLFTSAALLAYSAFVACLAFFALAWTPTLRHSVFVPGLLTILAQANIGLRARLRIEKRAESERVAARAMAESVRARDEFISLASHELKTPISSLLLQTQMLERDLRRAPDLSLPPEKLADVVALYRRQGARLNELVEAMLDVSRISAGSFALEQQEIDLCALVREAAAAPRALEAGAATAPRIDVVAPERLIIRADPLRLRQVAENLLSNAVKYGDGHPLRVEVREEAGRALLIVRDQGLGIPAQALTRIFGRFERAVSSRNISGLGLGLYVVRHVVEAHGGSVAVESELGRGSTFTVSLPLPQRIASGSSHPSGSL